MINQLRKLRIDKILSCADVGRLLNKTPECIGQYEKGRDIPLNDAYILAKIYVVTLDELYKASKEEMKE